MKPLKIIKNGIIDENPTFVQVIGMCPTLAVTSSATNGVGMGLSTTAVLICSNFVISLIRKIIPDSVRIPCYIVVIASFVTIVQMLLQAFMPELNDSLGVYIPLIVVNCIILARAEAFANKNTPVASLFDGIGMGLGFTFALTILGAVREFLGNGSVFGITLLPAMCKTLLMILPPGAFITLAFLMVAVNLIKNRAAKKEAVNEEPIKEEDKKVVPTKAPEKKDEEKPEAKTSEKKVDSKPEAKSSNDKEKENPENNKDGNKEVAE